MGAARAREDGDVQKQRAELLRRITLARERLGISKNELARRIGAAGPTVIEWFSVGALPTAEKMLRLPEALGVNGHWLLTGEGSPLPPGKEPTTSGREMRLGAQMVVLEVQRLLAYLEQKWQDGDVTPTQRAQAAKELELAKQRAEAIRESRKKKGPKRKSA